MTLQELLLIMQTGDMTKCKGIFDTYCLVKDIEYTFRQYDPSLHDITDKAKRPDKAIKEDDKITDYVLVARLPLALQKKIVLTAAAFLGTPQLQATPNGTVEENMMSAAVKVWDDNKMDYKFKSIVKKTKSQKQSAILFYFKDAEPGYWDGTKINGKFKLNMRVLSSCMGDTLYPVFDDYNDMIAFGRAYQVKTADNKTINHFDVYTADTIYYSKNESGTWLFGDYVTDNGIKQLLYSEGFKGVPNIVKKIPVAYFSQPLTEWEDVQLLIDRLEVLTSNHADTNDYSGSPIVFAEGTVTGFSEKGEQGKVLQGENGAKVSYLTFDGAPQSIKMEIENLLKYIYSLTHTPDTSFENLKGLGYFSTIALQTMFLDAHLKAKDSEEIFGEGAQRMINYMKAALASIDLSLKPALNMTIKPKFTYFLPTNLVEALGNIKTALDAGILSNETAIKLNPLISDPEQEIIAIDKEKAANKPPMPVPLPIPKPTNGVPVN